MSIRIAPGQTREEIKALLSEILTKDPPGGVKVQVKERPGGADSWLYTPKGPAFAAVERAYEKAWGHVPAQIGIGGSIPFVALFGRRYGHLPLILNGVLDPASSIHGPNQSMDLKVFEKVIAANVLLLDELGALGALVRQDRADPGAEAPGIQSSYPSNL